MPEKEPNIIKTIDESFKQISTFQVEEFSEGISTIHTLVKEGTLDPDTKAYIRSKFENTTSFTRINQFIQRNGLIELESKIDDVYLALNGALMGAIYMGIIGPIQNLMSKRTNPLEG